MTRVTLREIAEASNVSISTVSLVLNGVEKSRISVATRLRVSEMARDLGYFSDDEENSSSGYMGVVAMVSDSLTTTAFAGATVRGAHEAAWNSGLTLLMAETGGDAKIEKSALRYLRRQDNLGYIYATWFHRLVEEPAVLRSKPTVLVNCESADPHHVCLVPDERQGGRSATEILLEKGHRRVGFINTDDGGLAARGRLRGYLEALELFGVAEDSGLISEMRASEASGFQGAGYEAAMTLLSQANPPTALFCYNDRTAMGVYDAARELGLRIPDDLAVVGFDDQQMIATRLRPKLTTVALPHFELGYRGVEALLQAAKHAPVKPGIIRLNCSPVVRGSV